MMLDIKKRNELLLIHTKPPCTFEKEKFDGTIGKCNGIIQLTNLRNNGDAVFKCMRCGNYTGVPTIYAHCKLYGYVEWYTFDGTKDIRWTDCQICKNFTSANEQNACPYFEREVDYEEFRNSKDGEMYKETGRGWLKKEANFPAWALQGINR